MPMDRTLNLETDKKAPAIDTGAFFDLKRKTNSSVSGILFYPVIYLGAASPLPSSSQPPGIGRAALMPALQAAPVYLAFQPLRFTPLPCRHNNAWALTPRFHLYPPKLQRRRVYPPNTTGLVCPPNTTGLVYPPNTTGLVYPPNSSGLGLPTFSNMALPKFEKASAPLQKKPKPRQEVILCGTCCMPTYVSMSAPFPLGSKALCVVPTFLHTIKAQRQVELLVFRVQNYEN